MIQKRNDPCSCGSGKKFKHCCQSKDALTTPSASAAPAGETNQLIALFKAGHYAETERRTLMLLARYPGSGIAWKILGAALQLQNKDALPALQKSTELLPDDAEAHHNLAVARKKLGLLDDAVASYRRAIQLKPNYTLAYSNLGIALRELGQFEEAVSIYRRLVKLEPNSVDAHINLGILLEKLDKLDEAVSSYQRAIQLKPDCAEAHCNLGNALKKLWRLYDAVESYRRAVEIKPDYAEAYKNMGLTLASFGQSDDAIACYRRELELNPDYAEAQSSLLYTLNFSTRLSPWECLEEARYYGRLVSKKAVAPFSSWFCTTQPECLRVGIVSGDLSNHPVGYFLEGLLAQIDPKRIELIAYPNDSTTDALTARIKPYFAKWQPVFGLSDPDAARQIHADGIHVLLDMSGHTAKNRLPVFAWRPAPVQVTWLGLPVTTGMAEMDYVLGDPHAIPRGHENHFSETVWRLPDSYLCFTPPAYPINVNPLPALSNRHITFGSFNNLAKMNDETVALWARILKAVPDSCLYLKAKQLNHENVRMHTQQQFAALGIASERLMLSGALDTMTEHLSEYNKIDIALDAFPYPGVTTSFDALWMGVPVLSMLGDRFMSLTAKSIAHHASLADWVAADQDDYLAKAVMFASDLKRLADLRAGLRQQVLGSPLFDAPRFAQNLMDALWGMWQDKTQRSI